MKTRLGALVVSVFVCSAAAPPIAFGQETAKAKSKAKAPEDALALKYQSDPETPVEAAKLLSMWANAFDALLITDRFTDTVKIRFLTSTDRKMTWATIKKIVEFYDVQVIEEQPSQGGPWIVRATQRGSRNNPPRPGKLRPGDQLPNREEMVTAVFQLKHAPAQNVLQAVRVVLNRDTHRLGDPFHVAGPEVIIYSDVVSRVRYVGDLIRAMDVAGPRKRLEVFQLEYADAATVATTLTGILESLREERGPIVGRGQRNRPSVFPDPRTNRLAIAATAVDLPLIRRVLREFDIKVDETPTDFHVYRCKNVAADVLAERLGELFTGQQRRRPSGGAARPGGRAGPRPTSAGPRGDDATRIVPDPGTNMLLIQAEPKVYKAMQVVLKQLDKKPRRVMIEVLVYEVSTPTDQLTLGVELASLAGSNDGSIRPVAATSYDLSTPEIRRDASGNPTGLGRVPGVGSGLTAVLTKDAFDRLPLIISALHSQEKVSLVTRPFAMTDDNKEAEFTVTTTQPFLKNTTTNIAVIPEVDTVKAESVLKIKPRINSDDNLTLEVTLTLSSFAGQGAAGLPPGTNSRTFRGEAITVPNNSYVVFGGLESSTEAYVESKVPFLGDLPILGHLFKTAQWTKTKSRIFVFVRPTIFSDGDFAQEKRLGAIKRAAIQVEAERDEWIPPIVTDAALKGAGYTLQDEAIDRFGTGSALPF